VLGRELTFAEGDQNFQNLQQAVDGILPNLAATGPGQGAALVSYLAPFTGAVARTQANKNADTVYAEDFGAVADGTTDAGAPLAAAIAGVPAGTVIRFKGSAAGYKFTTAVTIDKPCAIEFPIGCPCLSTYAGYLFTLSNVSGVKVTGGVWTLSGVGAKWMTYAANTISNVTIEGVVANGSGVLADAQEFFSGMSGATLSNIKLIRNKISNMVIGISLNTDTSGSLTGGEIHGNTITDMVGTAAGQGYGIHHANGSGTSSLLSITDNILQRNQRHDIYISRAGGVTITGNKTKDHRTGVSTGSQFPSISIGRCTNGPVIVADNIIENSRDGCIDVFTDSAYGSAPVSTTCRGVIIRGNTFKNWFTYDAVSIGAPGSPATEGFPDTITIADNIFDTDQTVTSTGAGCIRYHCGKNIKILGNQASMVNIASATNFLTIYGYGESGASATYSDNLSVSENQFYTTGTASRYVRFDTLALAMGAKMFFENNKNFQSTTTSSTFSSPSTVTAPNIHVVGMPIDGIYANALAASDGVVKIVWRTTGQGAPSTGTWAVGDQAWKSDPAAGSSPGWICTAAGTPGTWNPMAALGA
jgi:hypothetical protein